MRFLFLILTGISLFLSTSAGGQNITDSVKVVRVPCLDTSGIRLIVWPGDSVKRKIVIDPCIAGTNWDSIPQIVFWRSMMRLHPDTALMSLPGSRKIVDTIAVNIYKSFTDAEKDNYRDSLRRLFALGDSDRILFTNGKSDFYLFGRNAANIDTSIGVFLENGVDPWYAEAILLIESPVGLKKSPSGAYGPFQLMKAVARKYGLTVNKSCDERKDLKRSAYAAAMLIKKICIPHTRNMLDSLNIPYNECDLWFRLLVMHSYHAGALNVKAALQEMRPTEGGMPLLFSLWQTSAAGFKNASQNYSQLIIASQLELLHRFWLVGDPDIKTLIPE